MEKFVTVVIKGVTYPVRFTNNSIADLEDRMSMGLGQMFIKAMSFSATRQLLCAGLVHKFKTMTPSRAGDLIDDYLEENGSIDGLVTVLFEGLKKCGFIGGDEEKPVDPSTSTTMPPASETSATAPIAG